MPVRSAHVARVVAAEPMKIAVEKENKKEIELVQERREEIGIVESGPTKEKTGQKAAFVIVATPALAKKKKTASIVVMSAVPARKKKTTAVVSLRLGKEGSGKEMKSTARQAMMENKKDTSRKKAA